MMTKEEIAQSINRTFPDVYSPTFEDTRLTFMDGSTIIGYFQHVKSSDSLELQNQYTFIEKSNIEKYKTSQDPQLITIVEGNNLVKVEYPVEQKPNETILINFITIREAGNIRNFYIPIKEEKKHLIITGKNGSGKTTLLNELSKFLRQVPNDEITHLYGYSYALDKANEEKKILRNQTNPSEQNILDLDKRINEYQKWLSKFGGTYINFNKTPLLLSKYFSQGDYIIAFFEARRHTSFKTPKGITQVHLPNTFDISHNAGSEFIQYIVNLKADRSFAKDDNDDQTVLEIDNWFKEFEEKLLPLFGINENVSLVFDRKEYNFNILEKDKKPYNFNQLSDGYFAILNIVTELIMRMEGHRNKSYDVQGVVLIDEIETHLHVDLQKKILPFLTSFFPKIQFIVTTHSPFILNSIEDAVICDLETKTITEDLSGYSYDTIIESYFDSDKYSILLKKKIDEYEGLLKNQNLNESDREKVRALEKYFDSTPKFLAKELVLKLQQLKLNSIKSMD